MMKKAQALNNFWNGFTWSAYDESTVPDDATLPYITYGYSESDFGHPVSLTASLWYRGKRWDAISEKLEEISEKISRGGVMVPYDDGAILIRKGTPFANRVQDEDDSIRRIALNVEVEFLD